MKAALESHLLIVIKGETENSFKTEESKILHESQNPIILGSTQP